MAPRPRHKRKTRRVPTDRWRCWQQRLARCSLRRHKRKTRQSPPPRPSKLQQPEQTVEAQLGPNPAINLAEPPSGQAPALTPSHETQAIAPDPINAVRVLTDLAATSSHPAVSMDAADVGPFQVIALSVIGSSHVTARTPREDAYAVKASDYAVIACVADGISSASGSRIAAIVASDIVASSLASESSRWSWSSRCDAALGLAATAVAQLSPTHLSQRTDCRVLGTADMERHWPPATTLAAVELTRNGTATRLQWLVLGDTEILLVNPSDGGIQRLSHAASDLLSDAPDRLGSKGKAGTSRTGEAHLAPGTWVLLASDGAIDGPLSASSQLIAQQLRTFSGPSMDLATRMLAELLAPVQGAYDDRTMVAIGFSAAFSGALATPGRTY